MWSGLINRARAPGMVRDSAASMGFKVALLLCSLAQGVVLARTLLPEGRGLVAVYLAPLSMTLPFVYMGIRQSSAYFLARENRQVARVATQQVVLTALAMSVGGVAIGVLAYSQHLDQRWWIALLVATLPFKIFTNSSFGIAMSARMIRRINTTQLVRAVAELVLVLVVVAALGRGVSGYFGAYLAAEIVSMIYLVRWLIAFPGYSLDFSGDWRDGLGSLVRKGATYAAPLYFASLFYNIDYLFLNRWVSSGEVGIYSIGVSFALLVWQFPAILTFVVFSYSVSAEDQEAMSRTVWRGMQRVLLLGLVPLALIAGLGESVIALLYGNEFRESYGVFLRLLPGVYLMIAYKMLSGDLAGRGRPLVALWIFVPVLVVKMVLNALVVPGWGTVGAAWVSSGCYVLAALAYTIAYRRICFGNSPRAPLDGTGGGA